MHDFLLADLIRSSISGWVSVGFYFIWRYPNGGKMQFMESAVNDE